MKFTTLAAVAAFAHAVSAIPAFITVSCPDAVTITQTVYPPGWTATGPIGGGIGSMPAAPGVTGGGVTTSWMTTYETTTTYCPTPGLYPPPRGLTNSLTAYMATTFTYSIAHPTGYVFNQNEYDCATCTKTVIVIIIVSETLVEIMTEVWSGGSATTNIQQTGMASMVASVPTNLTPAGGAVPTGYGSGSSGNVHTVIVGGPNLLRYTPQFVNAPVGDIVRFQFQEKNHTLTSSTFDKPCVFNGAYDSGFQPNINNLSPGPTVDVAIVDANPKWYFCAQTGHCSQGMVFAINPTADKSFSAFQAAAISGTSPSVAVSPAGATGTGGYGANYKSISDYGIFTPSALSGFTISTRSPSPPPTTSPTATFSVSIGPNGYGGNYKSISDYSIFTPSALSGFTISTQSPSPPPTTSPTATFSVSIGPNGYGGNYKSISDYSNAFQPSSISGFSIVSAAPLTTGVSPVAGSSPAVSPAAVSTPASYYGQNYPSVNMASFFTTSTSPATTAAPVVASVASSSPPSPVASVSYSRYGQNYPSVNMSDFFTSIPTGDIPVSQAAPTSPIASSPPPAATTTATGGGGGGGYGANYPSINFASAFTSVPTGFSLTFATPSPTTR